MKAQKGGGWVSTVDRKGDSNFEVRRTNMAEEMFFILGTASGTMPGLRGRINFTRSPHFMRLLPITHPSHAPTPPILRRNIIRIFGFDPTRLDSILECLIIKYNTIFNYNCILIRIKKIVKKERGIEP